MLIWWESNEVIKVKGDSFGVVENLGELVCCYMYCVFKVVGLGLWVECELVVVLWMNEFEYEWVFVYFMGEKLVKVSDFVSGGN